jgi:capsular polysaccharide transport system permease protein
VRQNSLFILLVIVPTLIATVLFGFVVADRYEAEARFVVRSPSRSNASALSSFLQSTGVTRASDEAFAVHEFIASRDAVHLLATEGNLRTMLSRPEADFLWGFPTWFSGDQFEKLYQHYQSFISLEHDQSTGISTLAVEAFRPDDAAEAARTLLGAAEKLINRLNDRARDDTLRAAFQEVEHSKQRAAEARERLTAFRGRESLLDPAKTSAGVLETISKLSFEVAQANAQLSELQRASPQSPQIASVRNRIAALEAQITRERLQIGGTDHPLAPKLAEYERLMLEQEFADRGLASALNSLEVARLEAQRQQLYLERIVEPRPSDYPSAPHRILSILLVFGIGLGLFFVIRTFMANARAHRPR